VPDGQTPLHDGGETVESLWTEPQAALDRFENDEIDLIFPTIRSLEALSRFDRCADLLEAARSIVDIPAMLPRVVSEQGGTRIVLPGDPAYDRAVDAAEGTIVNLPRGVFSPKRSDRDSGSPIERAQ
jgi:hypothetical protein